jgi:hypothetical protein
VGSNHTSFASLHPGLYADLAKLTPKDELDDLVERRTAANEARCIWRYAGFSNRRQGLTVPLPSRPDSYGELIVKRILRGAISCLE